MIAPWTRDNTRDWISLIETRTYDMSYYLNMTDEWLEYRDIDSMQTRLTCMIVTVMWVAYMQDTTLSKREILEIIGIEDWYNADEEYYDLDEKFHNMELEDLLEIAAGTIF